MKVFKNKTKAQLNLVGIIAGTLNLPPEAESKLIPLPDLQLGWEDTARDVKDWLEVIDVDAEEANAAKLKEDQAAKALAKKEAKEAEAAQIKADNLAKDADAAQLKADEEAKEAEAAKAKVKKQ